MPLCVIYVSRHSMMFNKLITFTLSLFFTSFFLTYTLLDCVYFTPSLDVIHTFDS